MASTLKLLRNGAVGFIACRCIYLATASGIVWSGVLRGFKRFLPSPAYESEKINYRLVEPHDLGALEVKAGHHMRFQKKSASRLRETDRLNQIKRLRLVEKEPHTGANQVLPQIATLIGV